MPFQLREYQQQIAEQATTTLKQYGLVYLAMQVRTGKTHTALEIAKRMHSQYVLFLTKKKAIASIERDYHEANHIYKLVVTNYEQLGKFDPKGFDLVICDEAHCLSAYPKPSLRTKLLKMIVGKTQAIFLSGTPTPEGYSQIYHQLYISENSIYKQYKNFYAWAREYVNVFQEKRGAYMINNYSDANEERIKKDIEPIMITYSQEEAGFRCEIQEYFHEIEDQKIIDLSRLLFKSRVIDLQEGKVVADTPAALMSKLHQITSGSVICDNGTALFSDVKVRYIKENFEGKRIAIYYKFIGELELIKRIFKDTTDIPEYFNDGYCNTFISQIASGREGITLSTADCIVFMAIDFSAVSYWQARARLQSLERKNPAEIHWIFVKGGIDKKVYKAVSNKKDFTASYFFRHGAI